MYGVVQRLAVLCQGRPDEAVGWAEERSGWPWMCVLTICLGAGAYGATLGLWRAPLQGLYTAIKFPLLLLLTVAGTGMINGMLAQILGSGASWRGSAVAVLMSFTVAALVLGALSPVTLFLLLNTPPLSAGRNVSAAYSATMLIHVLIIAVAGVSANLRLYSLLCRMNGRRTAAGILLCWLAVNLLLGSQLSWIMRPFIGSPGLPVEFLRDTAFEGNFFEAVARSFSNLSAATGR